VPVLRCCWMTVGCYSVVVAWCLMLVVMVVEA
jgi:hypothetical protein